MDIFLIQATVFLAAAVVAVPIAARLRLGSVLGYLLAGIAITPVLGPLGADVEDLRHVAEFGVVMMLFIIGLELEPRVIWDMRRKLIGLGGAQIGLSTAAIAGAALAFGQDWQVALALGLILSLSSTAIVLQTLSEKRLMGTQGGRSIFSVLLTQDVAVIPMLALLPLLAIGHSTVRLAPDGSIQRGPVEEAAHGAAFSLVEGLQAWQVALVTTGAVALIIIAGVYLTRPLFRFIHAAGLREMYTATALLIVVGIAALMLSVGLSPALGTFLAGVVLASTEFRHELESDLTPFKGLFLGLFFITVGAGIDLELLWRDFALLVGLTLGLMAIKGIVLYLVAVVSRLHGRDRWLLTLALAQAGEFGFVLLAFAMQTDVLPPALADRLAMVVALSMLLTPLFFIAYELRTAKMTEETATMREADEVEAEGTIIIAGIGRFGQVVNRMIRTAGLHTTILDQDLHTVELMRRFGFKGFFGDPTRPDILHAAGLREARILVVALDDRDAAIRLVKYARRERPGLHIVARARDRLHVYELYAAGADDIVRELFDSSLRAARYVLENMGLSEYEASQVERNFYQIDRKGMRELAELWVPGLPIEQNTAYMERARELNAQLEAALVTDDEEFTEED